MVPAKRIVPATIGRAPDFRSRYSPTGVPTSVRHLVAYHNPDTMGYEFWECRGFAVLTNHRYRNLTGDIVWVIGRPSGKRSFYLDCRFRVQRIGALAKGAGFRYEISADDGFAFYPDRQLNNRSWFQKLLEVNPNLSLGLQVVGDLSIVRGLQFEFELAKELQGGLTVG